VGGEVWYFFIEFDLCGDGHKLKTKLEINLAFQRLIFRMVAAKIILSLIVFFLPSFLSNSISIGQNWRRDTQHNGMQQNDTQDQWLSGDTWH